MIPTDQDIDKEIKKIWAFLKTPSFYRTKWIIMTLIIIVSIIFLKVYFSDFLEEVSKNPELLR